MRKDKAAAILTIFRAHEMTPKGRAAVVVWLRRQASFLSRHADQFSSRFRARYLYR